VVKSKTKSIEENDSDKIITNSFNQRSERMNKFRDALNKKKGHIIAHKLTESNPTEVKSWIPTGSTWLDSIICKGKMAGIPMGKIVEIAGDSGSGKSYLALQIGINALKQDIDVIYLESEAALDNYFIEKMGYNIDDFMYVAAESCESVGEIIEEMLKQSEKPMLFIWDSLAQTPVEATIEGDFDVQAEMGIKARILSRLFSKLTLPIAKHGSGLLIVNQLKTKFDKFDPWVTPGGKAPTYSYSLRLWLTVSNTLKNRIDDKYGEQIGSQITAKIKKSRFGSQGKECTFKILWRENEPGDNISIMDQESWYDAIKKSERVKSGAWTILKMPDGKEYKFQRASFVKKMEEEPEFKEAIINTMNDFYLR